MRKYRRGFTMIEVGLFLAITGALLVGIIVSTNNSIVQQRYNESVQNFAEFLRGVYGKVTNVQGSQADGGRSDSAIYGKLVTFGEEYNLEGELNEGAVFVYDVVGKADGAVGGNNVLETLQGLGAEVVSSKNGQYEFAGGAEAYRLSWGATIKDTKGEDLKGSLLVVRSPMSGTIYTYFYNEVLNINKALSTQTGDTISLLSNAIKDFQTNDDIDFCVGDADGIVYGGQRTDVRILANARNSSGVVVMPLDGEGNGCK